MLHDDTAQLIQSGLVLRLPGDTDNIARDTLARGVLISRRDGDNGNPQLSGLTAWASYSSTTRRQWVSTDIEDASLSLRRWLSCPS